MSSIGDIVLAFPFVRLLRKKFPKTQIDFVVKKEYEELIKSNYNISNIYSFDSRKGFKELKNLKQKIKQEKYTYIFDIHRNLRSYYLRKFSSAEKIFLYKKYRIKRWLLIRLKLNLFKKITPVYKAYINSSRKIGIVDDELGYDFNIEDGYIRKIGELLKKENINSNDFLIGVCPGAGYENKCWTVEGFTNVCKFLISKLNAKILLIGDEGDFNRGEMLNLSIGDKAHNFCGRLSIMETAALISKCKLVIANDAGPMHIAEALNKKLVAIFGPTVEEFGYFPVNTNAVIVQKMLFCRPCSNNGWKKCYRMEIDCMKSISSDDVINACLNLVCNPDKSKSVENFVSQ
ncbi:MAG: glycosyltransferase family 9 protein [Candidatus Helarchaeota archaeon]|nr:glycosyltransferase family 9 protein [Candidatus Helarchaeota archaeon]